MNCQIIYQIIVLIVVVFFGHMLIPEDMDDVDKIIGNDWSAKYNDDTKTTIAWGVKESILTE